MTVSGFRNNGIWSEDWNTLRKLLITLLVSVITFIPNVSVAMRLPIYDENKFEPVQARPKPVIAILDTALDSSFELIKKNIIFEACVMEWPNCPNGSTQMEGFNSASLSTEKMSSNFYHGTHMASLAVMTNSSIQIVFVRIIAQNFIGNRMSTTEVTVNQAFDWVLRNGPALNVQAVVMAQGHHDLTYLKDYCPKSPITESKFIALKTLGIPVFLPAGNGGDLNRIDWPACLPSAIAIGAATNENRIATYSNFDSQRVEFFIKGNSNVMTNGGGFVNISGTSVSAVKAAVIWATVKSQMPNSTYDQILIHLRQSGIAMPNITQANTKLLVLDDVLKNLLNYRIFP